MSRLKTLMEDLNALDVLLSGILETFPIENERRWDLKNITFNEILLFGQRKSPFLIFGIIVKAT